MLASSSMLVPSTLKSLLASAEKISAGARMVMLIRLTIAMSGFTRRA